MTAERILILFTFSGSFLSFLLCIRAHKCGFVTAKPLIAITGTLALIYAVAYVLLFILWAGQPEARTWTQYMRGVSIVSWFMVWCGWPLWVVRQRRYMDHRVEEITRKVRVGG